MCLVLCCNYTSDYAVMFFAYKHFCVAFWKNISEPQQDYIPLVVANEPINQSNNEIIKQKKENAHINNVLI